MREFKGIQELPNFVNSKGNIKKGEREVLEATNNATIQNKRGLVGGEGVEVGHFGKIDQSGDNI